MLEGCIRALRAPKIATILFALVGLLVLPGCWVRSISGLYDAGLFESDKDQIFDPGLLGTWGISLDKCSTTVTISAEGKEYRWLTSSVGEGCDKDGQDKSYSDAILFKLDEHQFLDLTARPEDVCEMCMRVHWILLIRQEKDAFTLTPIDSDWLKDAEQRKTVTLATLPNDTDTVTASPKELKRFCRKYADNTAVFKPDSNFTFKRK